MAKTEEKIELTKEQLDQLQDAVDKLRMVPGNLNTLAEGTDSGPEDMSDALYLVAEFVKEKVEKIAGILELI